MKCRQFLYLGYMYFMIDYKLQCFGISTWCFTLSLWLNTKVFITLLYFSMHVIAILWPIIYFSWKTSPTEMIHSTHTSWQTALTYMEVHLQLFIVKELTSVLMSVILALFYLVSDQKQILCNGLHLTCFT